MRSRRQIKKLMKGAILYDCRQYIYLCLTAKSSRIVTKLETML